MRAAMREIQILFFISPEYDVPAIKTFLSENEIITVGYGRRDGK